MLCTKVYPLKVNSAPFSDTDIVHENLKMGSDGESDQASGTSSDEVQSPTGVCLRNRIHRRISMEVSSQESGSTTIACIVVFVKEHAVLIWNTVEANGT